MKAAVYHQTGAPEVLVYEDVPDPDLTPDGVRRVSDAGCACSSGGWTARLGAWLRR